MEKYKVEEKIQHLEDIDLSGTYSYADYLKWDIDERLELIKGKIFPVTGPSTRHQRVSMKVSANLYNYLESKTCEVFTAPFDVRLTRNAVDDKLITTVVQPDLCVICDPAKIDSKGCVGAPDIVVEILSPGNNRKELKNKYDVYEEAGVREYWVFHPEAKLFFKYVLNETGKFESSRVLTSGDEVTSPILPGLSLSLDEVFRDLMLASFCKPGHTHL